MRLFATSLALAALIAVPAQAQSLPEEEPEAETGSRLETVPEPMKTNPKSYDEGESRSVAKRFGKCLFDRRTEQSIKLLAVSDYRAINYAELGESQYLLGNRVLMEQCLGRVSRSGLKGIGMRISNMAIRASLVEAAYLDAYGDEDQAIAIDPDSPEFLLNRIIVPGPTHEDARAAAAFADCVVYRAPAEAHAIVHAQPASRDERSAINAIVPALGACLPEGRELKLDFESIRAMVADGLWARNYYGPMLEQDEASE